MAPAELTGLMTLDASDCQTLQAAGAWRLGCRLHGWLSPRLQASQHSDCCKFLNTRTCGYRLLGASTVLETISTAVLHRAEAYTSPAMAGGAGHVMLTGRRTWQVWQRGCRAFARCACSAARQQGCSRDAVLMLDTGTALTELRLQDSATHAAIVRRA